MGCRRYIGIDILEGNADIVGNSQDPDVIAQVVALEPNGWDIIFIDGDHSREAARADYEAYRGLVAPGGFLALHDTHHDHWDKVDGAAVLWPEIEKTYNQTWDIYFEADYLPYQKGTKNHKQCGIGLVRMEAELCVS